MRACPAVRRRFVLSNSLVWLSAGVVLLVGCIQRTARELPDCEPAAGSNSQAAGRSSAIHAPNSDSTGVAEQPPDSAFLSTVSPFERGPLDVRTFEVEACVQGPPVPLRIHTPAAPGQYAVVLFHHGFMTRNSFYDSVLTHVASHGLIVVAPQSYEPGFGALSGNPNVMQEAEYSREIVSWIESRLEAAVRDSGREIIVAEAVGRSNGVSGATTGAANGPASDAATRAANALGSPANASSLEQGTTGGDSAVIPRPDLLTIGGHSRGGLAAWLVCEMLPGRFAGIVGVDPVGGAGGRVSSRGARSQPAGDEAMPGPPAVILGAGLGGSCAPAGRNYEQFFASTVGPAWKIVATEQGHGDMLDEKAATAAGQVCDTSRNREPMRRLTAGLIVLTAQRGAPADSGAEAILNALPETAPTPVVIERK
ncbi:MAG: hypothetical protein IPM64_07235 [Phycisphaerales bacterium]|nr:hypothetical protein [Phycisphaerales bacterium]